MAWTAPRTWTNGLLVTAPMLNTDVRDNELFLRGFHGGRLYQSVALNHTANGSLQLMTWDLADYDTDSFTVAASDWMVVPTGFDGYYRITAQLDFFANATGGRRSTKIVKNETYTTRTPNGVGTSLEQAYLSNATGFDITPIATWTGPLVAGDHVTVEGFQNSGGNLAYQVGKDASWMECHYLGS
jgi:hypothetical protein